MNEAATRDGYGDALLKLGESNKDIVALDGDLLDSTRSIKFAKAFPERFFNMGISEADMVCTAAGLAFGGKIPFASSFACFLVGRAYDQAIVSVAYPNLNVKLIGSHGGIATGEDGPTAQALSDVAAMRALPNFSVILPADYTEAAMATTSIAEHRGPVYMRLARPKTPLIFDDAYEFQLGKAVVMRDGKDITIISSGILLNEVMTASDLLRIKGISAGVLHLPTIKPLDVKAIAKVAKATGRIVTCEDHSIYGGLGSAVTEILAEIYPVPVKRVGLSRFAESGSFSDLYKRYGLDAESIAREISNIV